MQSPFLRHINSVVCRKLNLTAHHYSCGSWECLSPVPMRYTEALSLVERLILCGS